uniref:Uncharacterized protein n=1 Tax=Arundo donax TaxID=35708 RepID=A0A0A8YZZ9_ARUDO
MCSLNQSWYVNCRCSETILT